MEAVINFLKEPMNLGGLEVQLWIPLAAILALAILAIILTIFSNSKGKNLVRETKKTKTTILVEQIARDVQTNRKISQKKENPVKPETISQISMISPDFFLEELVLPTPIEKPTKNKKSKDSKVKEENVPKVDPVDSVDVKNDDVEKESDQTIVDNKSLEIAQKEAEEKARLEAEEKARLEAEEKARQEAEEKARLEAEEKARLEAEEKARLEAEEKARLEAEEKARLEAEEKARQEAEEKAKQEAEEKAKQEAEEKARQDAEEKARLEAEEKSRQEAEEKAKQEAEEKARLEAEEKAKQEAEEKARLDAEEKAKQEAEEKARLDAEEKARQEAEEKARLDAEHTIDPEPITESSMTVEKEQETPVQIEKSEPVIEKVQPEITKTTAKSTTKAVDTKQEEEKITVISAASLKKKPLAKASATKIGGVAALKAAEEAHKAELERARKEAAKKGTTSTPKTTIKKEPAKPAIDEKTGTLKGVILLAGAIKPDPKKGKFVVTADPQNMLRPYKFVLKANNGLVLYESEGYKVKPRAAQIYKFKKAVVEGTFTYNQSRNGTFNFKIIDSEGKLYGTVDGFKSIEAAQATAASIKKFGMSANFIEDPTEL